MNPSWKAPTPSSPPAVLTEFMANAFWPPSPENPADGPTNTKSDVVPPLPLTKAGALLPGPFGRRVAAPRVNPLGGKRGAYFFRLRILPVVCVIPRRGELFGFVKFIIIHAIPLEWAIEIPIRENRRRKSPNYLRNMPRSGRLL